jgi:hypothetical protein
MVAGTIGTRHCSPGGVETDRVGPIVARMHGGPRVAAQRVTHSLRDMTPPIVTGFGHGGCAVGWPPPRFDSGKVVG